MEVTLLQIIGALAFLMGTIALGLRLRGHPTRDSAERLSRISHLLFRLGLDSYRNRVPLLLPAFLPRVFRWR